MSVCSRFVALIYISRDCNIRRAKGIVHVTKLVDGFYVQV